MADKIFGILAEFKTPASILDAAGRAYACLLYTSPSPRD